eukprot:SAG31_NODE_11721_length_1003_cov_3.636062_1_plen_264_part_01
MQGSGRHTETPGSAQQAHATDTRRHHRHPGAGVDNPAGALHRVRRQSQRLVVPGQRQSRMAAEPGHGSSTDARVGAGTGRSFRRLEFDAAEEVQRRVPVSRVRSSRRVQRQLGRDTFLGQPAVGVDTENIIQANERTRGFSGAPTAPLAHRGLVADAAATAEQRRNTTPRSVRAWGHREGASYARRRAAGAIRQQRLAAATRARAGGLHRPEPLYGSAEYWGCPGGREARGLAAFERPGGTQKQYDRWVTKWLQWCQLANLDPL